MERFSHVKNVGLLVILAFLFLMAGNNLISLTHPDEVFYAQTAKEMLVHHSWLVPYIFDYPQFEKPILFYWLLAVSFKFFGITPFVARFWPALFGIIGVIITYWFSWMLFRDKKISFMSGFILATSFIYLALSRAVLTDMVFSILVVLTIVLFYASYIFPRWKTKGLIMSFGISGLAVLTKGVLGIVFPCGVILIFLLYKKNVKFLWCRATLIGVILFSIIALPWHIYMYHQFGNSFIKEYWQNVHVRRIFEAEHQKSNTWYFYPLVMLGSVFPWGFFWPPVLYFIFYEFREKKSYRTQFVFLFIIIAVIWGTMQVAASKLASYIFPLFPALAILFARYFSVVGKDYKITQSARIFFILLGITLLIVAVGVLSAGSHYRQYVGDLLYPRIIAGVLVGIASVLFFTVWRKYWMLAFWATGSITAVFLIFILLGRSQAEPWISCKEISEKLKKVDNSNTPVLCSKFYVRGVRFYTDRKVAVVDINGSGFFSPHPIPFFKTFTDLNNFLQEHSVTYGVLKKSNVQDLERLVPGAYRMKVLAVEGGKYLVRIVKNND